MTINHHSIASEDEMLLENSHYWRRNEIHQFKRLVDTLTYWYDVRISGTAIQDDIDLQQMVFYSANVLLNDLKNG